MKLDYKKELEKAAKQTLLVRRIDTLIKLILRTIVRDLKVKHAGILLYDRRVDEYVVKVSHGRGGIKVPSGFVKIKKNNPLIRYFTDKKLAVLGREFLPLDKIRTFLSSKKCKANKELKDFFEGLKLQFTFYNAKICIPGFFRDKLVGILFLGQKINRKQFTQEELGFISI